MNNKLYIAAAGAGKTTFLTKHAIDLLKNDSDTKSIAIITYTQKNQEVILDRIKNEVGYIPNQIKVMGWYSFILDYCVRPFMGAVIDSLYCTNVGLLLVEGISNTQKVNGKYFTTYSVKKLKDKFLTKENYFYSDKLSEFAYSCYQKNKKIFIQRLADIFSSILIDEVQDMSAWDYSIIGLCCKIPSVQTILCGDLRQKTYSTSPSPKWKKYKGRIDLFLEENVNTKRQTYIIIDKETLNVSHRFGQEIANFANRIIGNEFPAANSCSCPECKNRRSKFHDRQGVFLVKKKDVTSFLSRYSPLVLIWDKSHKVLDYKNTINYAKSKGITTEVCLICPTNNIVKDFLSSRTNKMKETTRHKFYVAVTRAMYLSAILVANDFDNKNIGIPFWEI